MAKYPFRVEMSGQIIGISISISKIIQGTYCSGAQIIEMGVTIMEIGVTIIEISIIVIEICVTIIEIMINK